MKFKRKHAAVVVLFAMFLCAVACQKNAQTLSQSAPFVMLPKGAKNAEKDPAAQQQSAVIISIETDGIFYVGPEPYPLDEVPDKIAPLLSGQAQPDRLVFIAGNHSLDYGVLVKIIDAVRKEGVSRFGLLVDAPGSGRSSFRVEIPQAFDENEDLSKLKPNPLTLVAALSKDLKLKLNNDPIGELTDSGKLTQMLTTIFGRRKELHAYRPGMETRNDVPEAERLEKTVVIKATRSTRYADVINLIDAVKGAGANPIMLQIDDLSD